MEDKQLHKLFQDFNPELPSDSLFLSRLEKNLEAIELVKEHTERLHRRNRIAVVVAALCGLVMGVVLTLVFPLVSDWVSTVHISLPWIGKSSFTVDLSILAWLVIGGASVLTAKNAYDITVYKLSTRPTPN